MNRPLELATVAMLSASVVGLASVLAGAFHAPQVWLLTVLGTLVYAALVKPVPTDKPGRSAILLLSSLVVVTLLFRVPVYDYILGGQDQGIYTNIANHMLRTGGIEPADPVLPRLEDSAAKSTYISENYTHREYLPAVYALGDARHLEFQFYHLFSVWMALFAQLFGTAAGASALTLFAVIGAVAFFQLARLTSGSARAGLVAAFCLAINPLHVLFSKWSVSEVPALTWSILAFTMLVIYARSAPDSKHPRYLVLSALCFGAMFFTRISGFMYLPVIGLIAILAVGYRYGGGRIAHYTGWACAVGILYVLSVWYGSTQAATYSLDIYSAAFQPLLGERWGIKLLLLGTLLVTLWAVAMAIAIRNRYSNAMRKVARAGAISLAPLALVVLYLICLTAYQVAYTDLFVEHPLVGGRWGLANGGWDALWHTMPVVAAIYVSPLLFLGVFVLLDAAKVRAELAIILLFLCLILIYLGLMMRIVPYQPYYARYLLTEVVPCVILFVVGGWSVLRAGLRKHVVAGFLILYVPYALFFSLAQVGNNENARARDSLDRIASGIGREDLILIDADSIRPVPTREAKTALVFSYGLNAATISSASLKDMDYMSALQHGHDEVYLLSGRPVPPARFEAHDSFRYQVEMLEQGNSPPLGSRLRYDQQLWRYRLSGPIFPTGSEIPFRAGAPVLAWLAEGWSIVEAWGVWSNGHYAKLTVSPTEACGGPCAVELSMKALITPMHPAQTVEVHVDGVFFAAVEFDMEAPTQSIRVPLDFPQTDKAIEFHLKDAVSPQSLGMSADARILGVGLLSATLTNNAR